MRYLVLLLSFLLLNLYSGNIIFAQNRSDIDQKVDSVLNLMTLDEKIGQMTQAERGALENISDISYYSLGSLLSGGGSSPSPNNQQTWADMYDEYQSHALQSRLGIPLIYGVDAVHGHNNVYGAVIFPHNIGLGCTWNPALVKSVNEITALEVAATGIDWTFSPCIAVPQNERWGRTYEGFGETAEIQEIMAAASVQGLQANLSEPQTILACAKHYVGDGGTQNGIDQGNTVVFEQVLRDLHMPGYIDAIENNVGSIMASYNSWNGVKLHGHEYLLTDVLKNELGFEGFVISDWAGVDQITEDYREAVKRAINAGIDMVMVPDRYIYFISILKSLVIDGEVSEERIDDAVRRILKQKFLLNLFEKPYTDSSLASSFGSAEHRNVARQAVRESVVLLNAKNDVMPLDKDNQKILVAGSLANDLGGQCGGWTISWQGSNGNITQGTTILQGIQNFVQSSEVIYSENGSYDDDVDVAIVVIGENPYAEGAGDRNSLLVEDEQVNLVKSIKEKGIPVITLLVSGRPMIIGEVLPYTDAFMACWLPGTEGDGIAEVLFGDYNPSAKLTHSWPREMNQIPINYGDYNYYPLFAYKYGLQEFPSALASQNLELYCAIAESPNTITLTLSDKITAYNIDYSDIELKVNNQVVANDLVDLSISDIDESSLILELNSSLNNTDKISISYYGDGIFSNSLQLNTFNDYYVYNSVSGSGGSILLPGKVEAENYVDMQGIQTEPCTDIGGGLNVGFIEPGDWMKYNVNVNQRGLYAVKTRISGYNSGSLLIQFNNENDTYVNYQSTNGWQSWQTFSTEVMLEEGSYEMKVTAQANAFNINYFDFELINNINDVDASLGEIVLKPNPVKSQFIIELNTYHTDNISIKLYNLNGILIQTLYEGQTSPGINNYNFILDNKINTGTYIIEIKDSKKRHFKKLITTKG
ncbi:MAG: hypothetical protein C0595_14230 [Marinilabiliales bacterium]|nr:MAG: hypothetical protein C0595_14230 [Marinilabiliales bacterium]